MTNKEWKKKTNNILKGNHSVNRVRNNLIYYFLVSYFFVTIISFLVLGFLFFEYFSPYITLIIDNKEAVLNYINNTIIG